MSLFQKMIKQTKVEHICKQNGLVINRKAIDNLNRRIKKDVKKNEEEYISGLVELEKNPRIIK